MILFIKLPDSDLVKAVHTERLRERLNNLRFRYGKELLILAVCPGGEAEKTTLLERFDRHCGTEWLVPSPALHELITELANNTPGVFPMEI